MDFYLYLHVSEGVPVRKKDEILDKGRGTRYAEQIDVGKQRAKQCWNRERDTKKA